MTKATPNTTDTPGEVPASTGGVVDLDRLLGSIPVVLVFIEAPAEAGSRAALESIGETLADFGRDTIQILAVSPRSQAEVESAADDTAGNARILADPDRAIAARFGGRYDGAAVTTVLIGSSGAVVDRWTDVPTDRLAVELFARVSGLGDAAVDSS